MRILFLASYVPSRYKGAEIRLLYLLHYLSQRHDVTLWALNKRNVPKQELAELLPQCHLELHNVGANFQGPTSALSYRLDRYRQTAKKLQAILKPKPSSIDRIWNERLQQELEAFLSRESFDLIHVNQIMIWQYLPRQVRHPVLLSKDNAWASLAMQEKSGNHHRWPGAKLAELEAQKMARYERNAVASADHCVVVSEEDKERILELAPQVPVSVVPNGVDTRYFTPRPQSPGRPRLVFTGTMGWAPNAQAMVEFCDKILPIILADYPELQLSIVGIHPPPEVRRLGQHPNVEVTGFVPDVRPYIADADVYIVPLRQGSGTRLKILEAMAMGKPVVSTPLGAEGLDVIDGEHLLLADQPQDFASKVCDLLADAVWRNQIGLRARRLVECQYDWSMVANLMDQVYSQVVESAHATARI